MKTKKLLEKLKAHLDTEQVDKDDSLKRILKKLKKKQNTLKDKLKNEQDEKVRNQLQNELDVLFSQRKKGMKIRKELKEAKKK